MKSYLAYQNSKPCNLQGFFNEVSKIIATQRYMNLAVSLAQKGRGQTWTNPLVGAVIVKDDQILSTGYHQHYGQFHAEVNAIQNLSSVKLARGATIYVTLEPCNHFGKTPPCTQRLIDIGIKKVVIGQLDPNPLVAGKGVKHLQEAGIEVTILNQTGEINQFYNFFYKHQRPFVTLKYAVSLDGKINGSAPKRTLLTGPVAKTDSQKLRLQHQSILIGENTLTIDDPLLIAPNQSTDFPPIRIIVVDDANQVNPNLRIFTNSAPIWLLSRQPNYRHWPNFVKVFDQQNWTPIEIIRLLTEQGIQSLLVEGGSQVHSRFISSEVVDQIITYLAPLVLGGTALPAVYGTASSQLNFEIKAVQQLGRDLRIDARREN